MIDWFDRQGNPIDYKRAADIENRVAETTLPDGKWVSTVWLGLNHRFGDGAPLIFETMVFPKNGEWGELDSDRYETEADALAGHARIVEKWSKPQPVETEA